VIPKKKILALLIGVVIFLTAMSVGVHYIKYVLKQDHFFGSVRLFSLDKEANIPTWYQSMSLLFCSVLLGFIAFCTREKKGRFFGHWAFLALVFLGMSIDELSVIHEMLTDPLRNHFGFHDFLNFSWIVAGGIFVMVIGLSYLKFLWHLPLKIRVQFIIAGLIYIGGTLGMESIGGYWSSHFGEHSFHYTILTDIEELLEMTGILVFINVLLSYAGVVSKPDGVKIQIEEV